MSRTSTSSLEATSQYGPFSTLINVYGLKILGLEAIGGQPAVQNEFLKKTAQTFKLLLNPDAAGIDPSARIRALEGLNSYNVIQRVGVGSYDSYSPSLDSGAYPGWDQVNDTHNATDFIWHLQGNDGSFSPSGKNQTTESLEHALHTLSQYAFPAAFPEELNVYSSNGRADGISGDLYAAYEEAVRNGVYDPSDYDIANDGSDGYAQLLLREYVYCLIYAEWGFTREFTEDGTLSPEWSNAHLNPEAIARDNPIGHRLFESNISKIISKPSSLELSKIYQNGDLGTSGYLATGDQPTNPITDPVTDPITDPITDPATGIDDQSNPTVEEVPTNIETVPTQTTTTTPVNQSETPEISLYSKKGRHRMKGKPGPTNYIFKRNEKFGKKHADQIINFNDEEDAIVLNGKHYGNNFSFKRASSKSKLKKFAKQDIDLIYLNKKGQLFFNGNGVEKGFGDLDEGGLMAVLKGQPSLSKDNFQPL